MKADFVQKVTARLTERLQEEGYTLLIHLPQNGARYGLAYIPSPALDDNDVEQAVELFLQGIVARLPVNQPERTFNLMVDQGMSNNDFTVYSIITV